MLITSAYVVFYDKLYAIFQVNNAFSLTAGFDYGIQQQAVQISSDCLQMLLLSPKIWCFCVDFSISNKYKKPNLQA